MITYSSHTNNGRRSRLAAYLGAFIAFILVLTSCSPSIDDQVVIDKDGKGHRLFSIQYNAASSTNKREVKGGVPAIDRTIKKNLPKEAGLEYLGFKPNPKKKGFYTFNFRLDFANPEEYNTKIRKLYEVNGLTEVDDQQFVVRRSELVDNMIFEEPSEVRSVNLFQWLANALVKNKVVGASYQKKMFNVGSSKVTYDGQTRDVLQPIKAKNISENGFDSVSMTVLLQPDNSFITKMNFASRSTKSDDIIEKQIDYIKSRIPEGTEIKDLDRGIWEFHLKAQNAEELTDQAKKLFDNDRNFVEVERHIDADHLQQVAHLKAYIDASAVTETRLHFGFAVSRHDEDNKFFPLNKSLVRGQYGPEYDLESKLPFHPTEVDTKTTVGWGGSLTHERRYIFASGISDEIIDKLREKFSQGTEGTEVKKETGDNNMKVLSISFSGSAEEINQKLAAHDPGSSLEVEHNAGLMDSFRITSKNALSMFTGGDFKTVDEYNAAFPGKVELESSSEELGAIPAPTGSGVKLQNKVELKKADVPVVVKAEIPSVMLVVLIIVLVLLVVGGFVFLIWWLARRQKRARELQSRAAQQEQFHRVPTAPFRQGPQGNQPPQGGPVTNSGRNQYPPQNPTQPLPPHAPGQGNNPPAGNNSWPQQHGSETLNTGWTPDTPQDTPEPHQGNADKPHSDKPDTGTPDTDADKN